MGGLGVKHSSIARRKRTKSRESGRTSDLGNRWVGRRIRTRIADRDDTPADTPRTIVTIVPQTDDLDLARTTRTLDGLTLPDVFNPDHSVDSDGHTYSPLV